LLGCLLDLLYVDDRLLFLHRLLEHLATHGAGEHRGRHVEGVVHHSWVHPRLLESLSWLLLGLLRHRLCGCGVPDGVHLVLHVRALLDVLEVVGWRCHHLRLIPYHHLLELRSHHILVDHLHVLLLQELHVLELLLLWTIPFSSLPILSKCQKDIAY